MCDDVLRGDCSHEAVAVMVALLPEKSSAKATLSAMS
jgi:hypothetical protein